MKYYLVAIFCSLLMQACYNQPQPQLREEQGKQEALLVRAKEAHTLIEKIAYSFGRDTIKGDTMGEEFSYPEYCGGLYITPDKKVVVVCVGDTSFYRKIIAEKIGRNDFLMP